MQAAIIGDPVDHSWSPLIYNFIAEQQNLNFDYQAIKVNQNNLADFCKQIRQASNYLGFNITMPLKTAVMPELDQCSAEASLIKAVNVVVREKQKLIGTNTDIIGIQKTLAAMNFEVQAKNILIFGAGGAARAVAWVLGQQVAANVYFYNRNVQAVQNLINDFEKKFPPTGWHQLDSESVSKLPTFDLIVNATPLGMLNHNADLVKSWFSEVLSKLKFGLQGYALDLIYNPPQTIFLKTAQSFGLQTQNGLTMLVEQAFANWQLWLKNHSIASPTRTQLLQLLTGLLKLQTNLKPIFLTGMMGVGKSTVGRELATLTQRKFYDLDHLIEEKLKLKVSAIFKQYGEAYFRDQEQQVLRSLPQTSAAVVALGGGTLLKTENQKMVSTQGWLVALTAHNDILVQRLKVQTRPLLAEVTTDLAAKLTELQLLRQSGFDLAQITLNNANLSPKASAQKIILELEKLL